MTNVDWQAEGLLEGLNGRARAGREKLLEKLHDEGVSLDELRQAVAEERLVLLPLDRLLDGDTERYTAEEVAAKAGVDVGFLIALHRAVGMPEPAPRAPVFTERDVESAQRMAQFREVGVPEDEMIQLSRVIGIAMSQLAAANRGLGARVFAREGDTEFETAERFTELTANLPRLLTPTLEYALELHFREQIRHDAFSASLVDGVASAGVDTAIAFADLVGFTKLGERLDPEQIGDMTTRLGELAGDVATGPVRLVKLIGDAAMLTSGDAGALLNATLTLVDASEREGDGFPLLRAGVAYGPALPRGGDFYGRPVNLASRLTQLARPGSVLCAEAVREAAGEDRYSYSFAGARHLKGIGGETKLFRVRGASAGGVA